MTLGHFFCDILRYNVRLTISISFHLETTFPLDRLCMHCFGFFLWKWKKYPHFPFLHSTFKFFNFILLLTLAKHFRIFMRSIDLWPFLRVSCFVECQSPFWEYDTLDMIFSSNHNIHKSLCALCFWASDPLVEIF